MTRETKDQLRQQLTWERQRRRLSEQRCARAEEALARLQQAEERRIKRVVKETPDNDAWRSIL